MEKDAKYKRVVEEFNKYVKDISMSYQNELINFKMEMNIQSQTSIALTPQEMQSWDLPKSLHVSSDQVLVVLDGW